MSKTLEENISNSQFSGLSPHHRVLCIERYSFYSERFQKRLVVILTTTRLKYFINKDYIYKINPKDKIELDLGSKNKGPSRGK